MTSLVLSRNTILEILYCWSNKLTNLDISNNTLLESLSCGTNQLISLDASSNTLLTTLICNTNPSLTTICINSSVNINSQGFIKDNSAEWSTDCKPLAFEDIQSIEKASVLKAYNLNGQEVPVNTKGEVIILLYDNGTREKTYVAE